MADLISLAVFLEFLLLFLRASSSSSPDSIFILGGQSNMAGRGGTTCEAHFINCKWDGFIPPQSRSQISILRFSAGSSWELAHEPLHWDIDPKRTNGVGPGMAFANELLIEANKSNIGTVGLVPCAIGGTHLREWIKGTIKYTNLVDRINASEKNGGKVRAFLWFQGESDAAVKMDADNYEQDLTKFITDLRKDLFRPELPIIIVKIAIHDIFVSPIVNFTDEVRRAEEAVKNKLPKITVVDAKEAIQRAVNDHKPGFIADHGHLSTYSEVEVGKMLAHAYVQNFT